MTGRQSLVLIGLSLLALFATPEQGSAASDAHHPKQIAWQFEHGPFGMFGTFDRASIQRGYQVYRQVCASCHAMKRIRFRDLAGAGFSEAEIKAIAAEYTYVDGPNDEGEMFERPGKAFDAFPSPFPNEQAARAANAGAYPPDLSLMAKARPDGPNYIYSLLTGYQEAPADVELGDGQYYNPYFPGAKLAMPPQLSADLVEFQDGTAATEEQMARDLVNFLQWAAEPEMEQRKQMGLKVMLFLLVSTIFFYVAKRIIWADVKK